MMVGTSILISTFGATTLMAPSFSKSGSSAGQEFGNHESGALLIQWELNSWSGWPASGSLIRK